MGFMLREGLFCCETGGHFVFLDIKRDRYLALDREAERSFRRWFERKPLSTEDDAALHRLAGSGLLGAAPNGARAQLCFAPPLPERSLIDEQHRPVRAGALAHALGRLALGALELRRSSLESSLERLKRRKAGVAEPSGRAACALPRVAAAFKHSAFIASSLDRCLPRSLAIAHVLLDLNVRPMLVIAVRLQPFGAHCWVQHECTLVNESLDNVRNFTPILVV